jgi:hypothetical protein
MKKWIVHAIEFAFFFGVLWLARYLCASNCEYPKLYEWWRWR